MHTDLGLKIHLEKKKCKKQFPCDQFGESFRINPILNAHKKKEHCK